jgi:hypothetical protein
VFYKLSSVLFSGPMILLSWLVLLVAVFQALHLQQVSDQQLNSTLFFQTLCNLYLDFFSVTFVYHVPSVSNCFRFYLDTMQSGLVLFFSSVNLASVTVLEITGIGINYEKLFVVCQHPILLDFVVFLIK